MNPYTIENLERCFRRAVRKESKYVGILIKTKGYEGHEVIINPQENFEKKLSYYKNAYDADLEHRHAEGVYIIGFTCGNSFEEIQHKLLQ